MQRKNSHALFPFLDAKADRNLSLVSRFFSHNPCILEPSPSSITIHGCASSCPLDP